MCNLMKIPKLFATFGYHQQLLDLRENKALKSTRSKKLGNGLMIGLVKPKYLTDRLYFTESPIRKTELLKGALRVVKTDALLYHFHGLRRQGFVLAFLKSPQTSKALPA
jgi:hypothetical protein